MPNNSQRNPRNPPPTPGQAFRRTEQFLNTFYNNPAGIVENPMQRLQRWIQGNMGMMKAKGSCAVCGKDVRGKGVVDDVGSAGRGRGAILCPQHAMDAGVGLKIAQFSPGTIKKTRPQPNTEQSQSPEQKKSPSVWEAFQGGMDSPDLDYDVWKRRYWSKGVRPKQLNWVQKWILPPDIRKYYRK
jgi:hypothetical protein